MRSILLACAMLLAPLPVLAAAITGVQLEQGQGGIERLRLNTDSAVTPLKIFPLGNPDRVVIDLPALRATGIALPPGYAGTLVRGVRFGQFDAMTSRIVLDVARPVKIVGSLSLPNAVLIDIQPFGQPSMAASPAPNLPAAAPAPVATPQATKPLIVIDAGHGGQDPGALGLRKTREKEVTLAFARALKDGLLRTGRYRVAMTREGDQFIMLPERVNVARKLKADMFISLHADSNPRPEARGLSVYTLSETASDDEAAALAERENKSDIIDGLDLNTADEDVASILIDLAQRETMNKSSILAEKLVENLHPKVTKLPNPHRFAGFRVLKAPDIPSILIEMGFLSNADDERLLNSREYQSLVVGSVIKALDAYRQE